MRLLNEMLGLLSLFSFLAFVGSGIVTLIFALSGRSYFAILQFTLWVAVLWLIVSAILYNAHKNKLEK